MEPLLSLPRDQFLAALDELQLDPARSARLVEQYNAANAPAQGAGGRGMGYNLLDNVIGYDDGIVTPGERLGAGVEQFAQGLLSDPLGTGAGILRGGYETIENAMAPGATPMDVMGAAGLGMLPAGLARNAAYSVPRGPNADFGQNFQQVFHYTRSPTRFSEFDVDADQDRLGPHVGTLQAAIDRRASFPQGMEMGEVMDLRADLSRPFLNPVTNRPLNETQLRNLISDVADEHQISRPQASQLIRQRMADQGYTNIAYINDVEDPTSTSYIMLTDRPNNSDAVLRRAEAAFDPAQRTSPNLMAANMNPMLGAVAMGASQERDDPLANLKSYIADTGGLLGDRSNHVSRRK